MYGVKKSLILGLMIFTILLVSGCSNSTGTDDSQVELEQNENSEDEVDTNQVQEKVEEVEQVVTSVKETDYTFTDLSAVMYAISSVNLRDVPSPEGNKIGGLNVNDEVVITGTCNETEWYRIEYQGGNAFVSSKYLVEQINNVKVEEEPIASTQEESVDTTVLPVETTENLEVVDAAGSSGVIVPTETETVGDLVWVPTNGGTKYHSNSTCSNMIDPIQVSLETATANGFEACKRCH